VAIRRIWAAIIGDAIIPFYVCSTTNYRPPVEPEPKCRRSWWVARRSPRHSAIEPRFFLEFLDEPMTMEREQVFHWACGRSDMTDSRDQR
jgi:hypothetical protein